MIAKESLSMYTIIRAQYFKIYGKKLRSIKLLIPLIANSILITWRCNNERERYAIKSK